ncbi:MAG: ATP-binding protein, partial [Chloroflexi bacterium]|nr:ATP-binding protein [Chloroflexota bacterium]
SAMTCSQCQFPNREGVRFCTHCGSFLKSPQSSIVSCAQCLGALALNVGAALRPQLHSKRQNIAVMVAPGLPLVLADSDRVTQILTNLLSNAHKYSAVGGNILLTIGLDGGAVRVDVQDDGIGLSPEEQAQVFNRFFRAKNNATVEAGGTGLGLAITRSLVEMHGGAITVSSTQGQGSVFSFTLPLSEQQAQAAAAAALDDERF